MWCMSRDEILLPLCVLNQNILADELQIDAERVMDLFYGTRVYRLLSEPKYGMQLMSDGDILEEVLKELRQAK